MVLACLHGLRADPRAVCSVLASGCLLLLLAGCQGGPRTYAYIESMNAERRGLEDRVYELEYELEMLGSEVDHYREENARLRRQMNGESPGPGTNSPAAPRPFRSPSRTPAVPRTLPPDDLAPPRIDTGDPDAEMGAPNANPSSPPRSPAGGPNQELPRPRQPDGTRDGGATEGATDGAADDQNESAEPDAAESDTQPDADLQGPTLNQSSYRDERAAGQATEFQPGPDDVVSVSLDPRLTGGVDLDDAPGDDGVTVAIELRDARGQLVPETGPVSVALIDPQLAGPAARVARWDLDADQVARLVPDRRDDESMVLHMAWSSTPPTNKRLRLFVRYQTADGRKLDAQRDIEIRLPTDGRQTRSIPAAPARPVSQSGVDASGIRQASGQQSLGGPVNSGVEQAGWRARVKN